MCHVQLIDYQQWLLALRLDGTLLGTRAVRVSAIEDRPLGKTKDDIDAAFITADLIGRPKATYSYVEVAAVAYPGIAEVETAAICTNNRYLQVTDLARLHALTLAYSNGAGILLVSSQNDGDARFRHLSFAMCAFLLRNAAMASSRASAQPDEMTASPLTGSTLSAPTKTTCTSPARTFATTYSAKHHCRSRTVRLICPC